MRIYLRTVCKAVTYRVISFGITLSISYLILRDIGQSVLIGFVDAVIKTGLYYVHERRWKRTSFLKGRRL